jgi:hypothetical protein
MKKFLLVAGLSFGLIGAAYAGGAFQGYPLVGGDGASNCLSAGNNGVCNQYQPAGPATVPSTSTIPADTNVQGAGTNANPATVAIPVSLFQVGGLQVITTGAANTVNAGIDTVILNGVGATEAITLPAAPTDNTVVTITNSTAVAVATFSVVANSGQSLVGVAPTNLAAQTNNSAAAAQSFVAYVYRASNTTWYRVF